MAVIDELGITVTVNTSDGPLPEFDDPGAGSEIPAENNPTRFCHKYVESVGGAEFYLQIVVRQGPRTSYLRGGANDVNRLLGFYLDIDGKRVSSRMSSASALDQGELNCKIEGRRENNDSGGATLRKYMFAPINTVDDEDTERVHKDKKLSKNLGTIRLKVLRAVKVRSHARNPTNRDLPVDFVISERALKGRELSHGTGFSAAVAIPKIRSLEANKLDSHPVAVFVFKYRSRQALQRELIIPRSLSPVMDRLAVEDMPIEELRRLARERLDQIEDERIKGEDQKLVPKQRGKRQLTEAFDLTGDTMIAMPLPKELRRDESPLIKLDEE